MSVEAQQISNVEARRVAFHTFGCRSNYADTVELQGRLVEKGHTPTTLAGAPDIVVVNSCTVTDEADRAVWKLLREVREEHRQAQIVVTGCMAEVRSDELLESGLADVVMGPGRREELLRVLTETQCTNRERKEMPLSAKVDHRKKRSRFSALVQDPLPAALVGPSQKLGEVRLRSRFHLRIQEGCNNHCTFCIIPATRGALISRGIQELVEDVRRLEDLGYQEVVLTGTHIGGFGEDRGENLAMLLRNIVKAGASFRVRLSSIDPNDVSSELLDVVGSSENVCRHFHLCVQAFDDELLKRMNRRYRTAELRELCSELRRRFPACGIGADVICGFPGESRKSFERALRELCELPFSYLQVFPYSERAETPAAVFADAVPVFERRRRSQRLRAEGARIRRDFHHKFLGRTLDIILEHSEDSWYYGRSAEYLAVKISAKTVGALCAGQRVQRVAVDYDEEEGVLQCQ